MKKTNPTELARKRRKKRFQKKIRGTPERPRLCVYRSNKHIYAQIVDDQETRTLAAVSTLSKELASLADKRATKEGALKVGELIAKKARERNIQKVVFDRNGFLYHGRIRAVADGARQAGLEF
ncbi:MAG: 50S ribosomal protein L18 [Thermodesulfobacteriota bacterium]